MSEPIFQAFWVNYVYDLVQALAAKGWQVYERFNGIHDKHVTC